MASIIVPAYNEEPIIEQALRSLLASSFPGKMEIVVCCNGCTDGTAAIARRFEPAVKVIEIPIASKSEALNAGDAVAESFPRIYMDADVQISADAVASLVRALEGPGALAASPRMIVDSEGASYAVRAFYDIWLRLPYHQQAMVGSGIYALSRAGRERFGKFPNLIADDGFVRAQFAPSERVSLKDCTFRVRAPRTLAGLIRIKTRSALGNIQLRGHSKGVGAEGRRSSRVSYLESCFRLAIVPANWPKLLIYAGVQLVSRARARSQRRMLDSYVWERDRTSGFG